MILDATTKSLQFVLSSAVATNQLPCVTSWADINGSTLTPGSADTQSNNTTAVTVVAAPGASTQRQIKSVSIYNADTANASVSVVYNDNSTLRTIVDITLSPGDTLQYAEEAWSVINNGGQILKAMTQTPGGSAGGDLSGSYPNPTVAKINGITLPGSAPSANEVLTATSATATAWQAPAGATPAWQFDVTSATYGAVGDGQVVTDGAMTASSSTLACTTSTPFTSGDVGKYVIVNGATGTGSAQVFTISSFTDSAHVTLSATATTTVSSAAVMWGTDDTAAFQSAINAAGTYMATYGYAQVYKPMAPNGQFYMIAGALVNTGSANAQLTIPNPSITAQQGTLHFYGEQPGVIALWDATIPQVWGGIVSTGVWSSTAAQVSNYGTWGDASVLGSTPSYASLLADVNSLPAFANINVIVENWAIVTPSSDQASNYTAISLRGCAKGTLKNCSALTTTVYFTSSGSNSFPVTSHLQNGESVGMVLPGNGNNAVANAYDCTVSGYTFGMSLGEQGVVKDGLIVGNGFGFKLNGADPISDAHLIRIQASVQKCFYVFWVQGASGSPTGFFIDADIDMEVIAGGASALIQDSNSGAGLATLFGEIRLYGDFSNNICPPKYPVYVRIISNANTSPGGVFSYNGFSTAGSGVPVQNPYWRDAQVYVSGGTVSAIKVGATNGGSGGSATTAPTMTATGLTGGTFSWPSGSWLEIDQSSNPTVNVYIS